MTAEAATEKVPVPQGSQPPGGPEGPESPSDGAPGGTKIIKIKVIPLDRHEEILSNELARHKREINQLRQMIGSIEGAHRASMKDVPFLRVAYNDLGNIQKGLEKFGPDSFKNAMFIVDWLWSQYKHPWGMYKRVHVRKYPPWWQMALGVVSIIVVAAILGNPGYWGPTLDANKYFVLAAAIIILVVLLLRRRKAEKPS